MFEKELIERVCNLTWTKEDIARDITTIKYDPEFPFEKYYSMQTIIAAINKYLSKEWDDKMLSHWACIYNWIIRGGFYENRKENFNSFETFLVDVISWDLDGLSFFDEEHEFEGAFELDKRIAFYENFDHIWQTRGQWSCFYALVGELTEENGSQYVLIFNDNTKEYMILCCDHIENGYQDERIHFIENKAFMELVDQIVAKEYKVLPSAEKYYYEEVEYEKSRMN